MIYDSIYSFTPSLKVRQFNSYKDDITNVICYDSEGTAGESSSTQELPAGLAFKDLTFSSFLIQKLVEVFIKQVRI